MAGSAVERLTSSSPVESIVLAVVQNLRDQHDWTDLEVKSQRSNARQLIRGLPPRRLYVHPDDQIAALSQTQAPGAPSQLLTEPDFEWVLAVHPAEKWSLARLAEVFDSVEKNDDHGKRIVLATLHNDSTVVYYLMHEGMVKPRQN